MRHSDAGSAAFSHPCAVLEASAPDRRSADVSPLSPPSPTTPRAEHRTLLAGASAPQRRCCCGGACYRLGVVLGQTRAALTSPFRNAAALRDSPAELWVCIWLQSLISLNCAAVGSPVVASCVRLDASPLRPSADFALALIITEYLSQSFHLSDLKAGLAYGLFGTLTSLFAFPAGLLSDYLGIRWSLFISGVLNLTGRLVLALTRSGAVAQAMLFSLLPLANALDFGVCATAVRRFTPPRSRVVAFALLSSFLSLGQLLAGLARDAFVLSAAQTAAAAAGGGISDVTANGGDFYIRVSGQRALLLFGAALAAVELGLSGFAAGKGAVSEHQQESVSTALTSPRSTLKQKLRIPPAALVAATLRDAAFWRFSLLLVLCSIVRMLLQYVTAAMPKYVNRLFGAGVPVGSLLSIPPLLCIFLVPLLTTTTAQTRALTMITAGALVSALSLLWLVASVSIWAVVLFLVTLALGDALWSPRLFDYAASVSPPSASSTWSALGAMPLFMAKLPAGLLSGVLLEEFVPTSGKRRPRAMWAIVAAITAVAPVAMILLRRVIQGAPDVAAVAAAPQEAPHAAGWGGFSAEPVELADAFLHGGFGVDSDEENEAVEMMSRPGTARADDPNNPFT